MKKYLVSKFANYKAKISNGSIDLWEWLLADNEYRNVVDIIRQMPDKIQRNQYKAMLPAVTISGIFRQRKTDCLIRHTGLICIDIDKKENPEIADWEPLKIELSKFPYILYCGLSVSAAGIFCIIEIADPERHLDHFQALQQDFLDMGIVIDSSCKDICRLRGYSYDEKAYVNRNAIVYNKTIAVSPIIKSPTQPYQTMKTRAIDARTQLLQSSLGNATVFPAENIYRRIQHLVDYVVQKKIDITVHAADWFVICAILSRLFREDGRVLFQQVSQFYPNYTVDESDAKFTYCLSRQYSYPAERIVEIARKYGIDEDLTAYPPNRTHLS